MKEMFKKICKGIASCGIPQRVPFSDVIGSVLAFPLLIMFHLIHSISQHASYGLLACFIAVSIVALLVTLKTSQEQPAFVMDKVIGLALAFVDVPLNIRLALVGFVMFHATRYFFPLMIKRLLNVNFDEWIGHGVTIFCYSILTGLVVNGKLHLMLWATQ